MGFIKGTPIKAQGFLIRFLHYQPYCKLLYVRFERLRLFTPPEEGCKPGFRVTTQEVWIFEWFYHFRVQHTKLLNLLPDESAWRRRGKALLATGQPCPNSETKPTGSRYASHRVAGFLCVCGGIDHDKFRTWNFNTKSLKTCFESATYVATLDR